MSRNLLLFFGAGASKPLGIPTNREFFDEFLQAGTDKLPALGRYPRRLYDNVKANLGAYGVAPVDLEAIMTILTALSSDDPRAALLGAGRAGATFALATDSKRPVEYYGAGAKEKAARLLRAIRTYIRWRCAAMETQKLEANFDPIFHAFCDPNAVWKVRGRGRSIETYWNRRSDKVFPRCWCFTTNYDRALEEYFTDAELPYHQGWSAGSGERRLDPRQIHLGVDEVTLCKLHGSVDFIRLPDGSVGQSLMLDDTGTTLGGRTSEQVLIFPTQEKELFRFPFIDFFEEFVRALREVPIWCFVGFSFADEPIRRLVTTEATRDKKIIVVGPSAPEGYPSELHELEELGVLYPLKARVGDATLGEKLAGLRDA